MKKSKSEHRPKRQKILLRTHRQLFTLNNEENKALNHYVKKYGIKNKSKFLRETVMLEVIHRLETDSPTLFD